MASENQELISVMVPIYNAEKYLHRCVDSILAQTYTNIEVILVNDGSTDNCGRICDEYAKTDNRVRVIHKENGGQSSARNVALDIAQGDFISWVDSDDWIAVDMHTRLHALALEYGADIVCCGHSRPKAYDDDVFRNEGGEEVQILTNIEAMRQYFEYKSNILNGMPWGKIIRRALYENIRYPLGRSSTGAATTYKTFFQAKRIVVTNRIMCCYYQSEGSIARSAYHRGRLISIVAGKEQVDFVLEHQLNALYKVVAAKYWRQLRRNYFKVMKHIPEERPYIMNLIREYSSLYKNKIIRFRDIIEFHELKEKELIIRYAAFWIHPNLEPLAKKFLRIARTVFKRLKHLIGTSSSAQ